MQQLIWHWLFYISYAAWAAMEIWVVSRDRRAAKGATSDKGSLWFIIILFNLGIAAAFSAAFIFRVGSIQRNALFVFLVGIFLIWVGMAFRLWAISTLGKFFRTTVFIQDGHKLISGGPYKLLRHPAYTGSIISFIGIGLALDNWLSAVILFGMSLVGYGYRILIEERALNERFGEAYQRFSSERWRLLPLIF